MSSEDADRTDRTDNPGPTTESVRTRWDYTNDVVTILIVATLAATWAGGVYGVVSGRWALPTSAIANALQPVGLALGFFIAMMAVWLYGAGALQTVLDAIKN